LVAAGLLYRAEVVRAVPSLAGLYDLAGMPVNVRGLSIADVRSVEEIEDGVPILVVTGTIANLMDVPNEVPRLRLAITGAGGQELYVWTAATKASRLEPGESSEFKARLAAPPADGKEVAVRFADRRDLVADLR
jgi:hypothetical protein